MDAPVTDAAEVIRRAELLAEYETGVPQPYRLPTPTPAPLNRHARRRYAALARAARTR